MKISTRFSTYFWLSCLTILESVVGENFTEVSDKDIYKFFKNVVCSNIDTDDIHIDEGVFPQIIDRFNYFDLEKTFNQNFYINTKYYVKPNNENEAAIVLLITGAMSDMQASIVREEFYLELAKNTNALILALEPRFFGNSQPFTDLKTENLRYLHTEQTLADLAWFIKNIPQILKTNYFIDLPTNLKWMTTGKEYGGTIAAWSRLKYPHLIDVSVSFGAPMWEKLNYDEYYDRVEEDVKKRNLTTVIKNAYDQIKNMINEKDIDNRKSNLEKLKNNFKMCDPIIDSNGDIIEQNVSLMFYSITYYLSFMSQSSYETFKSIKDSSWDCLFDANIRDEFERLGKSIETVLHDLDQTCLESNYAKILNIYKSENLHDIKKLPDMLTIGIGSRPALFQHCFEFGQFEAAKEGNMFHEYIPLKFYLDLCKDTFNKHKEVNQLSKSIATTNRFYGENKYEGRNSIFINHVDDHYKSMTIKNSDHDAERIAVNVNGLDSKSFEELTAEDRTQLKIKYFGIFEPLMRWLGKSEETATDED